MLEERWECLWSGRIRGYIDEHSSQRGGAKVSKAQFGHDLHYTPSQVDYTIKRLLSDQYVVMRPRSAKHGGILCNAYCLTQKGRTVLLSLSGTAEKGAVLP